MSAAAERMVERPASFDVGAAYVEHAAFIARVVRRLVGSGQEVEDLLQETFVTAWKRADSFAGRSSVRTWLYGIARNLAMRHNRSRRRFYLFRDKLGREPLASNAKPDQHIERVQDSAAVQRALEKLSIKQREVLVLYEIEQLSGEEIATLLDVKRNAIWQRLHDARRNFTVALQRELDAAEGKS